MLEKLSKEKNQLKFPQGILRDFGMRKFLKLSIVFVASTL